MMKLQDKIIIEVWERIANQHLLESALTILNSVMPEIPKKDFAEMSIGRRNYLLTQIRDKLIGRDLNCFTVCPKCNSELEFSFSLEATINPPKGEDLFFVFIVDDYVIRYRLPNSIDLAAASKCKDFYSAKNTILNSCLIDLTKNDQKIFLSDLPEEIILKLSHDMSIKDPAAESVIDLVCQDCNYSWATIMDIAFFLIAEINFYAKNILRDVHQLASAYGWSESEIIGMSPPKRNWYLNALGT
jgi:hypothetical protein